MHYPSSRNAPGAQDRAAVVTRAILLIISNAMRGWWDGDRPSHLPMARAEIEATLRDEFADIARQTRDEIRIDEQAGGEG